MATIKDIAQLAGVSQGTVSNVLNGKGIVSSEKIRLVENAAAALGYTVNEKAKLLRQGRGKILAVILPTIRFREYVDFYLSFKSFGEKQGYTILQYLSDDNPETELSILSQIRSGMTTGIATFSCQLDPPAVYRDAGFSEREVLFVERGQKSGGNYIGFDYERCGRELASFAVRQNLKTVTVVTHTTEFSNEAAFLSAFTSCISASGACSVSNVQTDHLRRHQSAIGIFSSQPPEGIFTSAYSFAKTIRDVWQNFFASVRTSLCTVSPMFTMPESDFTKYELDYRLLGKVSAETLIDNLAGRTEAKPTVLENTGFRTWSGFPPAWKPKSRKRLNVLTLDSPADAAIGSLSRIYAQTTGVEVNISVLSYDEVYKVFTSMDDSSGYDVVRLDVTWLSWFAQRILRPLEDIDPAISSVFERFLPGLSRQYSYVEDRLYALPVSPSNQILFYRKDMFESTVLKRLYHEAYKARLSPPKSFKEYNRIARFFTRAENGQSPLEFGTTVTLGSTGVAGTEFITRYFSYTDKLFTDEGCILLGSEHALHALQDLIEVRRYSKEQPCAWWTNAAQEFAHGNTAMTILYSNFASDLLGKDSRVINKIGYAVVPGANPIIGGGTLGVSKFSRFPEQALAFIRWMCSEPISSALTLLGSVPACRNSFENYEIVDIYPWLELSKECVGLSHFRRTPSINNSPFDERRFLEILGSAVMKAYYGKVSAREALSEAQQQYEANAQALTARP